MKLKLLSAAALGMLAAGLALAAPAVGKGPPVSLEYRGQAIVSTGTSYSGTTVGGLSSITYDPALNVYYVVSDDPGSIGGKARFYTVGLDIANGGLSNGDVHFDAVTTLLAPGGQPYAPSAIDPSRILLPGPTSA